MPESSFNKDVKNSGVLWLFIYLFFLLIFMMSDYVIVVSISFSALLTVLLAISINFIIGRNSLYFIVNDKCKQTINKISNEALIFFSSGLLLVALSHSLRSDSSLYSYFLSLNSVSVVLFCLFILPLSGLIKLHPIIGFTLFQPIVYLNVELLEVQKYLLWVCYWVISLQLSPLSIINITTSNAFNVKLKSLLTRKDFINIYFLGLFYSSLIILYGEI